MVNGLLLDVNEYCGVRTRTVKGGFTILNEFVHMFYCTITLKLMFSNKNKEAKKDANKHRK